MGEIVTVIVDCLRDHKIIASYRFPHSKTLGPSAPPTSERLISEAKDSLARDGLAPPFDDIEFKIDRR